MALFDNLGHRDRGGCSLWSHIPSVCNIIRQNHQSSYSVAEYFLLLLLPVLSNAQCNCRWLCYRSNLSPTARRGSHTLWDSHQPEHIQHVDKDECSTSRRRVLGNKVPTETGRDRPIFFLSLSPFVKCPVILC